MLSKLNSESTKPKNSDISDYMDLEGTIKGEDNINISLLKMRKKNVVIKRKQINKILNQNQILIIIKLIKIF